LTPACCYLAGAAPLRLVRDCPRDPKLLVVGCGVGSLLEGPQPAPAVADREASPWLAPEVRGGARPDPASDLWAAAAIVRRLLAAGGVTPADRLAALLGSLQSTPLRRPSASSAAAAARELALAGLASWDARRTARSSPAPVARAAAREPDVHSPEEAGPLAVGGGSSPWRPLAAWRSPLASPLHGRLGSSGARTLGVWMTLAPPAVAALLCGLLTLALLFGS
jgi:hypothetical protein